MSGDVATATVETLTAEVRVLMVGSRQVTLSVARQLDWIDITQLEPFGRVAIRPPARGDGWGGTYIDELDMTLIGRDRRNGVLSLAVMKWQHDNHTALPLIVLAGLR